MGTSYTIYAEVRVRDKWFSINPYVRKINGEVKMIPLKPTTSLKNNVIFTDDRIICRKK